MSDCAEVLREGDGGGGGEEREREGGGVEREEGFFVRMGKWDFIPPPTPPLFNKNVSKPKMPSENRERLSHTDRQLANVDSEGGWCKVHHTQTDLSVSSDLIFNMRHMSPPQRGHRSQSDQGWGRGIWI